MPVQKGTKTRCHNLCTSCGAHLSIQPAVMYVGPIPIQNIPQECCDRMQRHKHGSGEHCFAAPLVLASTRHTLQNRAPRVMRDAGPTVKHAGYTTCVHTCFTADTIMHLLTARSRRMHLLCLPQHALADDSTLHNPNTNPSKLSKSPATANISWLHAAQRSAPERKCWRSHRSSVL